MKINFFGWVVILFFGGMSGCNRTHPEYTPKYDHLILSYENPPCMEAAVETDPKATVAPLNFYIVLHSPCTLVNNDDRCTDLITEYSDPKRYGELSARFNDVARPDHWSLEQNKPFIMYIATENIEVVSDTDFDAAHPAGTSLEEYWQIDYISLEDIRTLGEKYDPGQKNGPVNATGMFTDPLPAFNAKKLTLMPMYFYVWLTRSPEQSGVHRFTFTYRNAEGKVLTATTEPIEVPGRN